MSIFISIIASTIETLDRLRALDSRIIKEKGMEKGGLKEGERGMKEGGWKEGERGMKEGGLKEGERGMKKGGLKEDGRRMRDTISHYITSPLTIS